MEKKNLKWYEAPQVEVVEMELQGILCGSVPQTNGPGTFESDRDDA